MNREAVVVARILITQNPVYAGRVAALSGEIEYRLGRCESCNRLRSFGCVRLVTVSDCCVDHKPWIMALIGKQRICPAWSVT